MLGGIKIPHLNRQLPPVFRLDNRIAPVPQIRAFRINCRFENYGKRGITIPPELAPDGIPRAIPRAEFCF